MTSEVRQSPHAPELRAAARHVGRRRFLTTTGAAAALAFAVNVPGTGTAAAAELDAARITDDPFTLGVASGDPHPESVLLWTRLAPTPYQADSGLPAQRVTVDWELALDERFRRVVRRGRATAHPEFHHTVHVEAGRLAPGHVYYYRFRAGRFVSPVGRTRTAPARHSGAAGLTFGVVSCQRYDQGYWTAYRHLADEDLDVVFHLGDYLYEYAVNDVAGARAYPSGTLPGLFARETVTLEDYRLRYALYKSDPDLRAAHAAHPFVVTWDDHETENKSPRDLAGSGGLSRVADADAVPDRVERPHHGEGAVERHRRRLGLAGPQGPHHLRGLGAFSARSFVPPCSCLVPTL